MGQKNQNRENFKKFKMAAEGSQRAKKKIQKSRGSYFLKYYRYMQKNQNLRI